MKPTTSGTQLTLDGVILPNPSPPPRAGAIGKVQRMIEQRPWLTCGEIADAVGEPAWRVSECLNKLKLEGAAQQRKGEGRSRRSLWAGTSGGGRELRDAALPEQRALVVAERVTDALTRAWDRAGAAAQSVDA